MPNEVADPYVLAIISSASVLLGGLVGLLAQLTTSRITRKSQREALEIQATYSAAEALRDIRRESYADFLTAANACFYSALSMPSPPAPDAARSLRELLLQVETKADVISILASDQTGRSLLDLMVHLRIVLTSAIRGESGLEQEQEPWDRVIADMKADLGVPRRA